MPGTDLVLTSLPADATPGMAKPLAGPIRIPTMIIRGCTSLTSNRIVNPFLRLEVVLEYGWRDIL